MYIYMYIYIHMYIYIYMFRIGVCFYSVPEAHPRNWSRPFGPSHPLHADSGCTVVTYNTVRSALKVGFPYLRLIEPAKSRFGFFKGIVWKPLMQFGRRALCETSKASYYSSRNIGTIKEYLSNSSDPDLTNSCRGRG